jgi:protease-4
MLNAEEEPLMDKNRKILISIFAFVLLSLLLSLFQIYFTMDKKGGKGSLLSSVETAPGIGILRINGVISMSGEGGSFGGPSSGGADAMVASLDDMANDPLIKAIVVRIDSPGGTVAATQEIFAKLMKIRRVVKKPLVASMGDIAASGGYYTASACDYIMANQGTITASIGVIAAAPNLKGLFEKLGIKMNVIKSGKYKDILSSSREMTADEQALLQKMIDTSYAQFLKDVSLGRNIPIDDIRPVADGRVMNGDAAVEAKLIDGIGTFEDALDKARSLAKLPADAPVYDERRNPMDAILSSIGMSTGAAIGHEVMGRVTPLIEYRYLP